MSVLNLSIATSGLPGTTKTVWCPRICAALADDAGKVQDSYAVNIRADGRFIDQGATRIHGITTSAASRTGVDETFALAIVCGLRASGRRTADRPGLVSCARVLVAWNAQFVCDVISRLFARCGEPSAAWLRPGLQIISLQNAATLWCRLPSDDDAGGYKHPTRDEAAAALLASPARELPHSPDSNLAIERSLYAALRERKAFEEAA